MLAQPPNVELVNPRVIDEYHAQLTLAGWSVGGTRGTLGWHAYGRNGENVIELTGGGQRRKKQAIVALARKILVRSWAMLRDGKPWHDPQTPPKPALRPAVLWRKRSFGSRSESGCRWVERLLTVVQTRRLQGRSVLGYLYEALVAHRKGLPAPSLLTAQ
jgi:hypothetical protein